MAKRINLDYFNTFKEIPLLFMLKLRNLKESLPRKFKKVLIINTCLIGEFMMSLPALRYFLIKNKVKADLIVSPSVEPLAKKIRGVEKVFIAKSIYSRYKNIKESKNNFDEYDFILVMRISKHSYKLLKNIKFKQIKSYFWTFMKLIPARILNTLSRGKEKQWKDVNFDIIKETPKNLSFNEIFNFNKKDYQSIIKKFHLKKTKKIIIHTGSGWPIKFWENEKWVELLNRLNKLGKFRFIFVGNGREEEKAFNEIKSRLKFKVYSLVKKTNIKELMLLMKLSNYFIGVDSGPKSMAHLADLPSINLLGPGVKNYLPLNKRSIVIDKSNCLICTNLFCYKRKTCLQKITVDEVFNAFKNILGKK